MKKFRSALASTSVLILLSALVVPLFSQSAMAQATTGGLKGVVSDPQNAAIAGADVTAKSVGTNIETKTRTNSEGLYSLPRLSPGQYQLTIEKDGFKKQEFQDVAVTVGREVTLDATLQLGSRTETVTITAAGQELVQKEQAQISNTFQARKVADLPSNAAGGGIDTLALLAPGVTPGFGNVNSNGTTLSVNGNRARSNNFTIDGADNNDLSIGGPNYFVDNQDIVDEFQVITNNFSAEYGRNQGAIVNIVTKAGTNDYHGTVSWIHRDQKLFDALTNIEKRGGDLKQPLPRLQNVYTGTIGGPVIKDKFFLFGSYQRITVRESFLAQAGNPTIAASDLAKIETIPGYSSNPALQTLRNFSAFAITDFGQVSERSDVPGGTVTIGGVSLRTAFPQRVIPLPVNEPEFSVRGDYRINDKNSVFYRQLYQSDAGKNFLFNNSGFTGDIPFSSKIGTGQWTSQLSSASVNEFRFNYNKLFVIFGGGCEGLKSCVPHPDNISDGLTNITFNGLTSAGITLQSIGAATNLPQGRTVTVYQFTDNYSRTVGKHQLKMGVDVRRLTNTVPFLPNVNGAFRFPSGNALTQNRPSFVNLAAGKVAIAYNETDQFYYFNDDFRIKDNLTLNLGVRYEYIGQPINTLNELSVARESDPAQALWKQSLPLDVRIYPKLEADKNNWAPRIGFAYRPGGHESGISKWLLGRQDQTVIRGGYSIAYDPPFYNLMLNISTSSPLVFLNTTNNPATGTVTFPLPSGATGAAVQQFARSNQIIATNLFDPRFFSQTQVSNNFYLPYAQQFQFGIQREIRRDNVVEARWVATKGTGLFQTLNRNPRVDKLLNGFVANVPGLGNVTFPSFANLVPPGITAQVAGSGACVDNPATTTLNEANACVGRQFPQALVRTRENTASSIYHSLQTRYQGRVFNQLDLTASYTWSKALDNASEVFTFQEASGSQHPFNTNAAERSFSGFDRRHAFSASWIWDVPFMKDQNGWLGRVVGGWQFNGVYILANGVRFTPSEFLNLAGLGASRSYDDTGWSGGFLGQDLLRPFYGNRNAPRNTVGISQIDAAMIFGVPVVDRNGFWNYNELNGPDGNLVPVTRDQVRYIFNGPGAAMIYGSPFGDVCRGCEVGPRLNNVNLGIFKNIRIRENWKLRFSLDMFNAFNHKNPGYGFNAGDAIPDRFIDDAGGADGFNDRTGISGARRALQFGLKFIF